MMVKGWPLIARRVPITPGSAPNCSVHKAWLSTTSGWAPGAVSSSEANVRPT
jgi:hypothetical protein